MKNVMKKLNKKGFTLAELLIVVAIIAVLVAISIPIFNSQLEKSRDAVSVANMRTAYAQAQTAYLTGGAGEDADVTYAITDGSGTIKVANVSIKSQSNTSEWSNLAGELPFTAPTDPGTAGNKILVFTYTNGVITGAAFE